MKFPETPESPKFSGSNQRWGRPFGQLSRFHAIGSVILLFAALVLLILVLVLLRQVR